ncbi:serine hydrolase domain-containing protein [Brevundimonas sp.]|uniref:serine hydrolase domain-containing protein n=1 Tax=Brevundimonas sp. TaxID=1871086 RepID=UPI0037C10581
MSRRTIMAAGGAAAAFGGGLPASARDAARYEAVLDAVFVEKAPVALAGGVVTREGLVWSGVRGVRRFGGNDPATLDDRWHLGSNTKAMTAALYGRLVEQGRARWSAPLGEVFPGVAIDPAWAGTTIRDVMGHRAGVKDAAALGMVFFMTARDDPRPSPEQRAALVERVLGAPPSGARGVYEYSNAGYMIVGAAVERITGVAWEEAMRAEVYGPLGLTTGGFGGPVESAGGGANVWGHVGAGDQRVAMDPTDPGSDNPLALGPAGTAHMTLADYAKWLGVFLNDGAGWIKPETVTTLAMPLPGEGVPYGAGWIVLPGQTWSKGPILTHDGSNTMWYATAVVAPGLGAAFIGLTNQGEGAAATGLMPGLVRAFGSGR